MIGKVLLRISICLCCALVVGCSMARNAVVDHAAGFPASHVITDVKETSDEYAREQQKERVEELNQEYEEFLRSRNVGDPPGEPKRSVVIQPDDNKPDDNKPDDDNR